MFVVTDWSQVINIIAIAIEATGFMIMLSGTTYAKYVTIVVGKWLSEKSGKEVKRGVFVDDKARYNIGIALVVIGLILQGFATFVRLPLSG